MEGTGFQKASKKMKCVICKHGETHKGKATTTLTRGKVTVVFNNVPAEICKNCGEQYYDESVTARLLAMAEEAIRNGVQVEVREYMAA